MIKLVGGRIIIGKWNRGAAVSEEGHRLARDTAQPIWTTGSTSLEAIRLGLLGEKDRALEMAAEVDLAAGQARLNNLLACVQLARGLAYLTTGDTDHAYTELRRLYKPEDRAYHLRESFDGVMFFAEAAARSGRHADAEPVLAE